MCKGALTSLLFALLVVPCLATDEPRVRLEQQCPFIKSRNTWNLLGAVRRVDRWFGEIWDEQRRQWRSEFDAQIGGYFFDEYGLLRRIVAESFADGGPPGSTVVTYGVWYDAEVEAGAVTIRRYQEYSGRELKLYGNQWYWVRPGVYRVVIPYPAEWYEVETKDESIVLIRTFDKDFVWCGTTTYYGDAGYPVRAESYDRDGSINSTTLYEKGLKTQFTRGERRYRYTYREGLVVAELYEGPGVRRELTYEHVLDAKGNWTEMRTYVDDGTGRRLLRRETRTIEYYGSD